MPLAQLVGGDVDPDVDPRAEPGALLLHLQQPKLQVALLQLELGDAIPQQPADPVGPLVDHHGVTGAGQLLGRREPGRARPDDRDRLAGQPLGDLRRDPSLVPGPVDDLDLDLLDRDRIGIDAQHTRGLARRRTEPAGELREVVRRVQPLDRLLPVIPPDQVVPLRDQVAERAALMAERDPTVHAATGLALQPVGGEVGVDLLPVLDPDVDRPARRQLARSGQERLRVSHEPLPSQPRRRRRLGWPRTSPRRAPAGSRAA